LTVTALFNVLMTRALPTGLEYRYFYYL